MRPEILRSELSGPILQLKAIGVPKIKCLKFIDEPSLEIIERSLNLLKELKCISSEEIITEYGYEISKIPLQPYLSNLLIQAY